MVGSFVLDEPFVKQIQAISLRMRLYLRNKFHFSEVYRSVNYIGSRAKWMNHEGVHVNFASDPM